MDYEDFNFAEWLGDIMADRGLSQKMVADITGYTPPAISKWLNEKRYPSIIIVNDFMNAFGQQLQAVERKRY